MNGRMRGAIALALGLGAAPGTMLRAAPPDAAPQEEPRAQDLVRPRLLADTDIISAGQTFHIAVVFDIEPHWHIYWKNPGDSGGATEVELHGPDGYEIGETLFPRPSVIPDPAGTTFGYEDRVVLFVPVTAPEALGAGQAKFKAEIDWVVCRRICLLGHIGAEITVATGGHDGGGVPTIGDPVLREHFERLPRPIRDLSGATARFDRAASRLLIEGPAQGHGTVGFYHVDIPGVDYGEPRGSVKDDRFALQVPVEVNPGNSQGTPPRVSGLLILGKDEEDPCYDVQFPLPGPG